MTRQGPFVMFVQRLRTSSVTDGMRTSGPHHSGFFFYSFFLPSYSPIFYVRVSTKNKQSRVSQGFVFVCLFVCLFVVLFETIPLIKICHLCRWRTAKLRPVLCSVPTAFFVTRRTLCCAIRMPAVIRSLDFLSLIRRTAPNYPPFTACRGTEVLL